MKEIKLTKGFTTTIDDDVFSIVKKFRWYAFNRKDGRCYAVRCFKLKKCNQRIMFLHHVIMGFPLNRNQIDHIDGNGLNNTRNNLRLVTPRQNCSNRKERRLGKTSSQYVGVTWDKARRKWASQITIDRKLIRKRFNSEEEAHSDYESKLLKLISNRNTAPQMFAS